VGKTGPAAQMGGEEGINLYNPSQCGLGAIKFLCVLVKNKEPFAGGGGVLGLRERERGGTPRHQKVKWGG